MRQKPIKLIAYKLKLSKNAAQEIFREDGIKGHYERCVEQYSRAEQL